MEKRGHDMDYEELYQDLQQYEKTLKDGITSLQKLFKAVGRETDGGE